MTTELKQIQSGLAEFLETQVTIPIFLYGQLPEDIQFLLNDKTITVCNGKKVATVLNWGLHCNSALEHISLLQQQIQSLASDGSLILIFPVGEQEKQKQWLEGYFYYDLPYALSRKFNDVQNQILCHNDNKYICVIAKNPIQNTKTMISPNLEWYSFLSVFDDLNEEIIPPSSITIETTTRCPHQCRTCIKRYIDEPGEDLPFEQFQRIANSLFPTTKTVHFVGFGEPLVHPAFAEMIGLVKKHHCQLHLSTSGVRLNEHLTREICEIGGNVVFSIDGAQAETFEYIRPDIKWLLLMKRLESAKKIKREVANPEIHFSASFVAQRSNIEDLPQLVELCHHFDIESLTVTEIQNLMANDTYFHEEVLSPFPGLVNAVYHEAKQVAEKLNVDLRLPQMYCNGSTDLIENSHKKNVAPPKTKTAPSNGEVHDFGKGGAGYVCQAPWHGLFVSVNGDVSNCCVLTDVVFGNVTEEEPMAIWKGNKFRAHRLKTKLGYPPKKCFHCGLFFGLPQGNPFRRPPGRRDVPKVELQIKSSDVKIGGNIELILNRELNNSEEIWKTYLFVIGEKNKSLHQIDWLTSDGKNKLNSSKREDVFKGLDGEYIFNLPKNYTTGRVEIAAAMVPVDFNPDIGFWISSAWQTDSGFLNIGE